MSEADDVKLTKPEQFAWRKQAKRLRNAIQKEGTCCACIHRDKTFGKWHCKAAVDRSHPQCVTDGKQPKFTVDPDVLKRFVRKGDSDG